MEKKLQMGHIAVFLYISSLIIGFAIVLNCRRIFNDQHIYVLKPLLIFTILLNLNFLVEFTALYFSINLSSKINPSNLIVIWIVIGWLSFFTLLGSIWYFLKVTLNLVSIKKSQLFNSILTTLAIGFAIVFIVGSANYIIYKTVIVYIYALSALKYTFLSLGIFLSTLLIIETKNISVPKKRQALRTFGWIFIVSFSSMIAINVFQSKTSSLLLSLLCLFLNLILLFGMKPFVKGLFGSYPNSSNNSLSIDNISEQFGITTREKQVLELIIKGKSNKEIEQELVISSHTVKNHIYTIFRKVGVQSRGQLINRVLGDF